MGRDAGYGRRTMRGGRRDGDGTVGTARPSRADARAIAAPDHPAYEASRRTFNAMAGGRPLAIFQPEDTADVVAAVRWAADADVGFGVRGGGHSVAGHSAPDS